MIVSVEGVPGCGKTTLCNLLNKLPEFAVVFESVDPDIFKHYVANLDDKEVVLNYQQNQQKSKDIHMLPSSVYIFDRYKDGNMCFVDNFVKNGLFDKSDFKTIDIEDPGLVIYLKSSVSNALANIKKRGRGGESGYDESYIGSLCDLHEKSFQYNRNVEVVDVDTTPITEVYTRVLERIREFVKKHKGL